MIGQVVPFDTVGKGQARGHHTPVFEALSGRITEEIIKALSGPEKEAVSDRCSV